MNDKTREQIPVETPRPLNVGENAPTNDTYISRQEELSEVGRDIIFHTLISQGNAEELWNFLERNNYRMKTRKNAAGEEEFIGIEDSQGKIVWLVDLEWYKKLDRLEKDEQGRKEMQEIVSRASNRESTNDEVREALKAGRVKDVAVEPETDPEKIN